MVLALPLHLDPIFIGAHQVSRFLLVSLSLPVLANWLRAHTGADAERTAAASQTADDRD